MIADSKRSQTHSVNATCAVVCCNRVAYNFALNYVTQDAPSLPGVPTPEDEIRRQKAELERLEQSWKNRLGNLLDDSSING